MNDKILLSDKHWFVHRANAGECILEGFGKFRGEVKPSGIGKFLVTLFRTDTKPAYTIGEYDDFPAALAALWDNRGLVL